MHTMNRIGLGLMLVSGMVINWILIEGDISNKAQTAMKIAANLIGIGFAALVVQWKRND